MLPLHNLGNREIDQSIDWHNTYKVSNSTLKEIANTLKQIKQFPCSVEVETQLISFPPPHK